MAKIAFVTLLLPFAFCALPFDLLLDAVTASDNHARPLLPTACTSLSGFVSRTPMLCRAIRRVSQASGIGVYFPHFMVAGQFDVEAASRRHLAR